MTTDSVYYWYTEDLDLLNNILCDYYRRQFETIDFEEKLRLSHLMDMLESLADHEGASITFRSLPFSSYATND